MQNEGKQRWVEGDDFSRKIGEKMRNHTLTPESSVWEAIERQISARRRKRRMSYLWLSASAVAAAVALLFLLWPVVDRSSEETVVAKMEKQMEAVSTPEEDVSNQLFKGNETVQTEVLKRTDNDSEGYKVSGINETEQTKKRLQPEDTKGTKDTKETKDTKDTKETDNDSEGYKVSEINETEQTKKRLQPENPKETNSVTAEHNVSTGRETERGVKDAPPDMAEYFSNKEKINETERGVKDAPSDKNLPEKEVPSIFPEKENTPSPQERSEIGRAHV